MVKCKLTLINGQWDYYFQKAAEAGIGRHPAGMSRRLPRSVEEPSDTSKASTAAKGDRYRSGPGFHRLCCHPDHSECTPVCEEIRDRNQCMDLGYEPDRAKPAQRPRTGYQVNALGESCVRI